MNGYASSSDQKVTFLIAAAVVIATMAFVIYWFMPREDVVYIEHGLSTITAKVAKDDVSRQKGLGGVKHLAPSEGLLMVYDVPDRHPIWMKDMEISIDVFWISEDGEVVHIEKNMKPESYPTNYVSNRPALYVLELSAGAAHRLNIKVGSQINIPETI